MVTQDMCKLIAFIVDELKAALINISYTVYQCHRQTLRCITHSAAVLKFLLKV